MTWLWLVSQGLLIEEYRGGLDGHTRASTATPCEVFRRALFPGLEIDLLTALSQDEPEPHAA